MSASLKNYYEINIMNTPVLSKKQQKKALSGKKVSKKGLRNVLAQPYVFSWPNIRNNDVEELKLLLETSMPAVKRPSLDIPWIQLHKMQKKERKAARNEARLKLGIPPPDENILNSVVMGVNAVTRLLEKNNASCVLLEANVEPMLLLKHIVSMADARNVSVILVPFLKSVMLETIGFASAAVALKKTVAQTEDHHFHNLYKKIIELAENLERNRPSRLDFKQAFVSSTAVEETVIIPEMSSKKHKLQCSHSFTLSTDVYKYRKSRKERVFVPESATRSEIITQTLDDDFISVGKDLDFGVDDTRRGKNKMKTRYVDIHEEDKEKSLEVKDDSMELDEYVSTDSNTKFSVSPDDEVGAMLGDVLYEKKSEILGISEKDAINFENDKPNKNFKYESLKVKRLQGNSKRVKATKLSKKKKK